MSHFMQGSEGEFVTHRLVFFFSQVSKKYVLSVSHSTMTENEGNNKYKWQKFKCVKITLML